MEKIAILITCFNRKEKTLNCLHSIYQQECDTPFSFEIFIVDGGSSDGTLESVRDQYPHVHITTKEGLFWAGGMRAAWEMAMQKDSYDYLLLVNDDTTLWPACFSTLFSAESMTLKEYGMKGIVVGSTCSATSHQFTYGGRKLHSRQHSKNKIVYPVENQVLACELGNANIMLVPRNVVETIGGLCELYTHGIADYDYTLRAHDAGLPVVACQYCGTCEHDHGNNWLSMKSSLRERINYLYSPKGLAYKEYLYYVKTFFPNEYIPSVFKLWLKTLFPFLWNFKKDKQ